MVVTTLLEGLNEFVQPAARDPEKEMRLPISGVYKIKGVGDVLTGRVEQGNVLPGKEVIFLPTHTESTACPGKIFTVEMHHKRLEEGGKSGDNIGMNVKALNKDNMPRVVSSRSAGALVKTPVVRRPTVVLSSRPTTRLRSSSAHSSLWLSTSLPTVRVLPALPSSTVTPLSCLARSRMSTSQSPGMRARRSKQLHLLTYTTNTNPPHNKSLLRTTTTERGVAIRH